MREIRSCFFQMLRYMRRDRMLFAAGSVPLFAGLFFRFGIPYSEAVLTGCLQIPAVISPYYRLIDICTAMLPSTMFCFVSAMVSLEEADEKTAAYLSVTPLGKTGYLSARLGVPAVIAFLITVILLSVCKLTAVSLPAVIVLAAGGTLQGVLVALFVLTISSNRLEGMAAAKLSSLALAGAAVPFFIRDPAQYVLAFLPSFWIGKAVCGNSWCELFPAFVLSALWIVALLKRYVRKL